MRVQIRHILQRPPLLVFPGQKGVGCQGKVQYYLRRRHLSELILQLRQILSCGSCVMEQKIRQQLRVGNQVRIVFVFFISIIMIITTLTITEYASKLFSHRLSGHNCFHIILKSMTSPITLIYMKHYLAYHICSSNKLGASVAEW